MRCLVVEDEPLSQEIMGTYIRQTPSLELVAICGNALVASGLLRKSPVDLIFLDINLPGISGMSLLRSLNRPPMIIFTTAYPEYAVEGFEADAVDYLLKPFPFERFLKAVNKAFERTSRRQPAVPYVKEEATTATAVKETEASRGFINVRADRKMHRIRLSDIHYLEAMGDYIKIHLNDRNLMIHETFRHFLGSLPAGGFIRIHKSFIVPVDRIRFLEGNQLNVDGIILPVGSVFREEVLNLLSQRNE